MNPAAGLVPKLSVVMPVYNERATIEEILFRVQQVPLDKEVIVVDDGSTDGSRQFLEELARAIDARCDFFPLPRLGRPLSLKNLRVFLLPSNQGKGAALRRGFREVRGETVVIQDADLECNPQEFPKLLEPIERGVADVVYGSRFLGGPHHVLLYWHSVLNRWLTTFSNMFSDLSLTDVWTCYKMFRRDVLERIELRENRFGFEPEVTAKVARGGWRVYEVPISYQGRTYKEGKKINWKDGIAAIWCVVRYGLFR
jgi:glycosyltransferase involved in cell wall biosynthesis